MQQHPLWHILQSPAVYIKKTNKKNPAASLSLSFCSITPSLQNVCWLCMQQKGYRSIYFSQLKEPFITGIPAISVAFLTRPPTKYASLENRCQNVLNLAARTENCPHYPPSIKPLTITFSAKQRTRQPAIFCDCQIT